MKPFTQISFNLSSPILEISGVLTLLHSYFQDRMKWFVVFVIFCVTLFTVLAEFEYEEDDFGKVGEQFEKRQGLAAIIEKRKKQKWKRKYQLYLELS